MSLTPVFEIGLWNAWIFWVLALLSMIFPDFLIRKEAKERSKRASQWVPYERKGYKILALLTHAVIMPVPMVYSIFLPLQMGTAWFYAGLVILVAALVMSLLATVGFANTSIDKPVTTGIYRISRNPIYVSGFLLHLSIAVASASWVMLLCAVSWIVCFHIILPVEESYLTRRYGEAYADYMKRTPRWIGIPKSAKRPYM